ncbi:MAG: GNAT family N-acetyltransferase [Endomicrobiaceae bacterium]|nr:GNAT family N-acetyltransferase [Endomicrobiaceae bacterium]
MIRQVKRNEFKQIINFANQIFFESGEKDFLELQPKVYNHPDEYYSCHYVDEHMNKIVGLIGTYPLKYQSLKLLGVGTVCVDPKYRNQGIMKKMLTYLDTNIAPNYDLLYLSGNKKRYENFGYYKSGQKISFQIKQCTFKNNDFETYKIISYQNNDEEINQQLYEMYIWNKNRVIERAIFNFYDSLRTLSYEIYLIFEDNLKGYLVYERKNNVIKEIVSKDDDLDNILYSFTNYLNLPEIHYEVAMDDENIPLLYDICNNYHISNLNNLKVINYVNVIETLLRNKKKLKKGRLSIKIIDKITLMIDVDNQIAVTSTANDTVADIIVSEKEFHSLLFDDVNHFYFGTRDKYDLISNYFPLVLPITITSIDSF